MTTDPSAPNRARFDAIYEDKILGRSFVEYPEYYVQARERYWRTLLRYCRLGLPPSASVFEIGGGQFAILASQLFGHAASVGDVVDRAREDVAQAELGFRAINLMEEIEETDERYDAVILLEVIEHLPVPPYVILGRLGRLLKPGGVLLITTPNGYRIRNVLYMLANRRILDHFQYPDGARSLGHQHEYTLETMLWHARRAGYETVLAEQFDDGWAGASRAARLARLLVKPVNLIPHLRNSLILALRNPLADGEAGAMAGHVDQPL